MPRLQVDVSRGRGQGLMRKTKAGPTYGTWCWSHAVFSLVCVMRFITSQQKEFTLGYVRETEYVVMKNPVIVFSRKKRKEAWRKQMRHLLSSVPVSSVHIRGVSSVRESLRVLRRMAFCFSPFRLGNVFYVHSLNTQAIPWSLAEERGMHLSRGTRKTKGRDWSRVSWDREERKGSRIARKLPSTIGMI